MSDPTKHEILHPDYLGFSYHKTQTQFLQGTGFVNATFNDKSKIREFRTNPIPQRNWVCQLKGTGFVITRKANPSNNDFDLLDIQLQI